MGVPPPSPRARGRGLPAGCRSRWRGRTGQAISPVAVTAVVATAAATEGCSMPAGVGERTRVSREKHQARSATFALRSPPERGVPCRGQGEREAGRGCSRHSWQTSQHAPPRLGVCQEITVPTCRGMGSNLMHMPSEFNLDAEEEAGLEVHRF